MTAFTITLLAIFLVTAAYAVGRLHQWYRQALERDEAWRDGYERAANSLFSKAVRATRRVGESSTGDVLRRLKSGRRDNATVTAITDAPSAGRHSLETRHEVTRRITVPDSEKAV
jgi:hypothetical protein